MDNFDRWMYKQIEGVGMHNMGNKPTNVRAFFFCNEKKPDYIDKFQMSDHK